MQNAEDLMDEAETLRHYRGEPQKAIEKYREAYNLFCELGQRSGMCRALNGMGMTNRKLGRYQIAHQLYQEAIELFKESNDRIGQAWILNNIGNIYLREQTLSQAYASYKKSYEIFHEFEETRGRAFSLGNIALIFLELGSFEKAKDYATESYHIHANMQIKEEMTYQLITLAEIYKHSQMYETAMKTINDAFGLIHSMGHKERKAICSKLKGEVYIALGSYGEAERCLNVAEKAMEEGLNRREYAACLYAKGIVYQKRHMEALSRQYFEKALTIYQEIRNIKGLFETYSALGTHYWEQHQYKRAYENLQHAHLYVILILTTQKPHEVLKNDEEITQCIQYAHKKYAPIYSMMTKICIQLEKYEEGLLYHQIGISMGWMMKMLAKDEHQDFIESLLTLQTIRGWIRPRWNTDPFTTVIMDIEVEEKGDDDGDTLYAPVQYALNTWVVESDQLVYFKRIEHESIVKLCGTLHLHKNNTFGLTLKHERKNLYKMLISPIKEYLPTDPNTPIVFSLAHQFLKQVNWPSLVCPESNEFLIEQHAFTIVEHFPQLLFCMMNHHKGLEERHHSMLNIGVIEYPNRCSHTYVSEEELAKLSDLFADHFDDEKPTSHTGSHATHNTMQRELSQKVYKMVHFATECSSRKPDPASTFVLSSAHDETFCQYFDCSLQVTPSFRYEYGSNPNIKNKTNVIRSPVGDKVIKIHPIDCFNASDFLSLDLTQTKIVSFSPSQSSGHMMSTARLFAFLGVPTLLFSTQATPEFVGCHLIEQFYSALFDFSGSLTCNLASCYRSSLLNAFKEDSNLREHVHHWDSWRCFGSPFSIHLFK